MSHDYQSKDVLKKSSIGTGSKANAENFRNDPQKAAEAGRKVGEAHGKQTR